MKQPQKNQKINYNLIRKSIVQDILSDNTSLKGNPSVPTEVNDGKFIPDLFLDRYKKLFLECSRVNQTNDLTVRECMANSSGLLQKIMRIESSHVEALSELAVRIVMENFDIDKDTLQFDAKITQSPISMDDAMDLPDESVKLNLANYEDVLKAKDEVHKRRLINALIQGCSNTFNSIFYMYKDELNAIDHRLFSLYQILIPNAEIMYYFMDFNQVHIPGGRCEVDFDKNDGEDDDKKQEDQPQFPTVRASAFCFPILVQELVKGAMETISINGLPQDKEMCTYVLSRADYYKAENWDMLLGVPLWLNIMELMGVDDMNLRHHVFFEICTLPVDEFHVTVPNVLAKNKDGLDYINRIIGEIKHDLRMDKVSETLFNLDDDDLDYRDLSDIDFKF